MKCNKCGNELKSNAKFCSQCGNEVNNNSQQNQNGYYQQQNNNGNFFDGVDHTSEYDPRDIATNKDLNFLCYLGPLFLIPYFVQKNSPFTKFHANQGLVLFIANIIFSVAISALGGVLLFLVPLISLVPLVFVILGIINALSGKAKELPFIGKFNLINK